MTASMLDLPQLTGTRNRARAWIEAANLPSDLTGLAVALNGHRTLAGTGSFADEVVKILLVERHAARVTVYNVDSDLTAKLKRAVDAHGVSARLTFAATS
jgi:hypothetical protein